MRLINFFAILLLLLAPIRAECAIDELVAVETATYGSEQSGAVLNRISKLEKDFTGANSVGTLNARLDSISKVEHQAMTKLNALEWNLEREVKSGGILDRLSALESKVNGTAASGGVAARLNALSKATFGAENVPLTIVTIPAQTLVKVELVTEVSSRDVQVGDSIDLKVAEDVFVGSKLVIAKGAAAAGKVTNVRKAKGWTGRNGKVDIDFSTVKALDGTEISTVVGDAAKAAIVENQLVDGASLVALNLSDEWSKVLVRGKNVDVKPGALLYVEVSRAIDVPALSADSPSSLTVTQVATDDPTDSDEVFDDDFYLDE